MPGPGHHRGAPRSDAAAALEHLRTAYAARLGLPVCITESYRILRKRKRLLKRKPLLAAVPGTSSLGLGIAVDLCGGIDRADSATYAWVRAHAPRFGWTNPAWAQPGGRSP